MTNEEAIRHLEWIEMNVSCVNSRDKVALQMAEEALKQPEQHWIPCSERLPDESGDYMLYRPHFWGANNGQITVCYWNNHDWSDNYRNDSERYLQIIDGMAWMPLPEPYKVES